MEYRVNSTNVSLSEGLLQYNTILYNIGNVWSPSQHAALITTPGVYYTVVTVHTSGCEQASLWLAVNNDNVMQVKSLVTRISPIVNVSYTRDNGGVIRLSVGDTVTVVVPHLSEPCYYINHTDTRPMSFFGILLSPDI